MASRGEMVVLTSLWNWFIEMVPLCLWQCLLRTFIFSPNVWKYLPVTHFNKAPSTILYHLVHILKSKRSSHITFLCRVTVYLKKYAHVFVVLCFVVVMQSFIMNSHEVFIHINQGCFAGTGAIVRLPQCQWSKPDGYGKISQCITTTKHNKAKTVCIFLGIYCMEVLCKYIEANYRDTWRVKWYT